MRQLRVRRRKISSTPAATPNTSHITERTGSPVPATNTVKKKFENARA
jgi:hypothetical protein